MATEDFFVLNDEALSYTYVVGEEFCMDKAVYGDKGLSIWIVFDIFCYT